MCLWLYNAIDNWSFSGLCSSIQWGPEKRHLLEGIEQSEGPLNKICFPLIYFGWYDLTGKSSEELRANHLIWLQKHRWQNPSEHWYQCSTTVHKCQSVHFLVLKLFTTVHNCALFIVQQC